MQLVERNLVSLDDATVIEKLLPELAAKKVLTGYEEQEDGSKEWKFEDSKGEITPRMLLNHTNGTGHTYSDPLTNEYLKEGWEVRNEVADPYQTLLDSPLRWQPGTHTFYGQGIDWIAVLIERLTKLSLVNYLQENIFDPLNMKSTGYEETHGGDITSREESDGRFWGRSLKQEDGSYVTIDPSPLAKPARAKPFPEGEYHTHPLGTGLASTATDLTRFLTILLNEGKDPVSGKTIISPESTQEMWEAQLPAALRNDSRLITSALPGVMVPVDLPAPTLDPEGSFGLACGVQGADRALGDGRKGRSKGSVYWFGAANTEYWVDPEKGIVVLAEGNYFPWNDEAWTAFVAEVEGRIYEGL
ncbi:beta-lactamase/transpeptidase-like protein, partial [Amniculicola lignicola CBS 123094]